MRVIKEERDDFGEYEASVVTDQHAEEKPVVVQVKVEREETWEVEEKHQELYNSLNTEASPRCVKTEKSSSEETTGNEDFPSRQCDEETDHVSIHADKKHHHLSPKIVPSKEPGENPGRLISTSTHHKCPHCSKTFSLQTTLKRHMKTHTSVKTFSCSQCEKRFTHRGYLNMHMRIHTCETRKHGQMCGPGQTLTGCAHCGDVLRRTSVLHTHPSNFTCRKCGKDLESPTASGTHTADKHLTCSQCGKPFSRRNALKVHTRIHTGEKPFTCSECGKRFRRSETLLDHRTIHTGEKPFSCPQCGKSFSRSSSLKVHMNTHTAERPRPCPQCGKSFPRSDCLHVHMRKFHSREKAISSARSLQDHQQAHTGEKPYSCSRCWKSFSCSGSLDAHVRTHTGERPFSCRQCGRSFLSNGQLNKHRRLHTGEKPFACRHCATSFAVKAALIKHLRIHTGEKPFSCSQCGRSFTYKENLTRHLRIHSGEKPFPCSRCGRSFTSKENLTRHLRSHTANGISVGVSQNLPWDVLADEGPSAFPRHLSSPAKAQFKLHLQKQITKSELEMDSIRLQIVARTLAIKQAALEVEMLERRLKDMKK